MGLGHEGREEQGETAGANALWQEGAWQEGGKAIVLGDSRVKGV